MTTSKNTHGLELLEPYKAHIKAIAFDIDGTFYKEFGKDTIGLMLPVLFHPRLFRTYIKARSYTRVAEDTRSYKDLAYDYIATELGISIREAEHRVEEGIMKHLDRSFRNIRPFAHVEECLKSLKEQGYRLGALSDFPISHKLETLGLDSFIDVAITAEDTRLKPRPDSFLSLANLMGFAPEEILYVGNSIAKDAWGAHGVSMPSALIWQHAKPPKEELPEDCALFSSYAELLAFFSL